jgi:type VI secretion system secreted protein VgrG
MPRSATQSRRELAVFTPLGDDAMLLRSFRGHEELSRLFSFDLEMLSDREAIHAKRIVGRNVTFFSVGRQGKPRYFNGYVQCFAAGGRSVHGTTYRATVVPWLWFLTRTSDCRIFQFKTTPQIVEQIFTDLGFSDFEWRLKATYEPREYCVQYRETDFSFVSRLLEEEGIFYFFRHENGKHTLVLGDHNGAFHNDTHPQVALCLDRQQERQLTGWEHGGSFHCGRWAQDDYNFETPSVDLLCDAKTVAKVGDNVHYERYDYPGGFGGLARGRALTRVRMEEDEVGRDVVAGEGTYRSFRCGMKITVARHDVDPSEEGRTYVLTSVDHAASLDGEYVTGGASGELDYANQFTCIPAEVAYRPARATPRPTVGGPQTAVVVGPPGEEIYTDQYGRVKVQFHWDREGRRNENSSCWLRMSHTHAGKGWGEIDLPRVGEEVIVAFLEGNPDRPIIKGRVYNAGQMPPFALPGAKTRCGGKTQTYMGSGYNEMSKDDTLGAEQIRTNAQHNMDSNVNNCRTLAVGVDRSADIGNNQSSTIAVDGTLEVGNDATVTVGNDATYVVGNNIVITAGVAITLQCGASTIHMNRGGVITISGVFVTSAAAANQSIVAPLTQVVGSTMLLQAGITCFDLGIVTHVKGQETSVGAAKVHVGRGEILLQGGPLKLGEVGAPMAKLPDQPKVVGGSRLGGTGGGGGGGGGVGGASGTGGGGGSPASGTTSPGSTQQSESTPSGEPTPQSGSDSTTQDSPPQQTSPSDADPETDSPLPGPVPMPAPTPLPPSPSEGVFRQDRDLNPNCATDLDPHNGYYSHTFIFTTNPDGTLKDTYSWGNDGMGNDGCIPDPNERVPSRWYQNRPEDVSAATKAISSGVGTSRVGEPDMIPKIDRAFNELKDDPNSPSAHTNWFLINNCKSEATRLTEKASQH